MGIKVVVNINTSWNIINFRIGLLKALKKSGYEIIVIAPEDQYSKLFEDLNFKYYNVLMDNKGSNPIKDIKLTVNYYKLFKKIQPSIVLNYTIKPNIYSTIAASYLKIPTINNIAGLGTLFVKEDIITLIAKKLYKFSQMKASHVFFQNHDDKRLFLYEKLIKKEKCSVLPGSGIDVEKFKPIKKEKDDKIKFLLIARMLWEKGVGEYVEAAEIIKRKYKNVEFQLLGFLDVQNRSAISKNQMQEWVNTGFVTYLGTSDNVQDIIAQADCIVLPSYYREGTPRTLLESASMGKPIITTDNVGCRDVVNDGINGYLCEIKNSIDLANKIEKMINQSHEDRVKMGLKGREKMILQFNEKIIIKEYKKQLDKLLNN